MLYRKIFGLTSGKGPEPLSTEEVAIPIKLGNFVYATAEVVYLITRRREGRQKTNPKKKEENPWLAASAEMGVW